MATPKIKDPQAENRLFVRIAAAGYVAVLFVGLHFAKSGFETFYDLNKVTAHMVTQPFNIFPVEMETILVSSYVYLIGLGLIHVEMLRRRRLRTKDEYGSAAWNTDFQTYYKTYADYVRNIVRIPFDKSKNPFLKFISGLFKMIVDSLQVNKLKVNTSDGNTNMLLSSKVVLNMNTRKTMRNNNILICGGSGSGKTRFEVKPNLLQANCSYVITDPSGEILKSCGSFLKKKGYKIKVFNLVEMEKSHSYNPFQYIRDEQGVLTMITALIKNTTPKGSSSNDPFWGATCSAMKSCCIA